VGRGVFKRNNLYAKFLENPSSGSKFEKGNKRREGKVEGKVVRDGTFHWL
jgi:hypothetical protein